MILKNKQAVLNIIGKKTMMKFICLSGGVITYETVIPINLGLMDSRNVRVEFDFCIGGDILGYDTFEYIFKENPSLISVTAINPNKENEEIYEGSEDEVENNEECLVEMLSLVEMDGETLKATVVDGEGDKLSCELLNDECVNVDTRDYSYMVLSENTLHEMLYLIDKAREYYGE